MATLSPGRRQQQQRQQHSQTSTAPTTSSFFAPTSASASASFVPSRSKPKLPFPLPDPYDDSANFVVHDPRGLFTRRRRESSASERSSASALSGLSSSRLGSAVSDQGSQGSETALAGGSEGEEAINGIGNSISALSLALAEHTTSELGISVSSLSTSAVLGTSTNPAIRMDSTKRSLRFLSPSPPPPPPRPPPSLPCQPLTFPSLDRECPPLAAALSNTRINHHNRQLLNPFPSRFSPLSRLSFKVKERKKDSIRRRPRLSLLSLRPRLISSHLYPIQRRRNHSTS